MRALENLAVVAVRFNAWWLGLPLGLGLLAAWWKLGRPRTGCAMWFWVGAAVVLFEFGYYSTGISDTGPIYHFELALPGAALAAHTVVAALERWPTGASATLAVHLIAGTGSFYVEQIARLDRLVNAIHHDADEALRKVPKPALLIYEVWPSEVRPIGWVNGAFPQRFRAERDDVLTYPRPPPARLEALRASYSGRSCYFFHRRSDTAEPLLERCDDAHALLERPLADLELKNRPLWVRPTAYRVTSFDPTLLWRQIPRDRKVAPCCMLDELREANLPIVPGATCIGEHDLTPPAPLGAR
jgi:hypothetical protein